MEQYYGWIAVALILIAVVLTVIFKPTTRMVVANAIILALQNNEAWLVMAVYNRLPSRIKMLGSENIAKIISYVLDELIYVLENIAKKR